jgi:hypothetical protein
MVVGEALVVVRALVALAWVRSLVALASVP